MYRNFFRSLFPFFDYRTIYQKKISSKSAMSQRVKSITPQPVGHLQSSDRKVLSNKQQVGSNVLLKVCFSKPILQINHLLLANMCLFKLQKSLLPAAIVLENVAVHIGQSRLCLFQLLCCFAGSKDTIDGPPNCPSETP